MRFSVQKLLGFLIMTRVLLLLLPWLTITLLFPEKSPQSLIQFTQEAWNRWDAPHYLYIANNWYTNIGDEANFIVFFPLYPLILKPLIYISANPVISAVLASTAMFLIGSVAFFKLVRAEFGERTAWFATVSLAVFPTAYFFNSPYTESLFLLVFSLAMYGAYKRKWFLSGVAAGLGVITRPFGILLLPSILIEWWYSKDKNWKQLPAIVVPSIVAGIFYLYLNHQTYGDMFAFQKILHSNWQKNLTFPLFSIIDSWRIAFSGGLTNFGILVGWAEALSITSLWIAIPFVIKHLRTSWAVFYLLSVLLLSSTGFILSTPRYILSIPPLFILLALAQKKRIHKTVWMFVSVALLFCFSILFTRGQWAF